MPFSYSEFRNFLDSECVQLTCGKNIKCLMTSKVLTIYQNNNGLVYFAYDNIQLVNDGIGWYIGPYLLTCYALNSLIERA